MAGKEGAIPNFGPPGGENRMPSTEELLEALENIAGLSEENKQELRESILNGGLAREAEKAAEGVAQEAAKGGLGEIPILLVLISIVFLILVFFGYKLYSSLMEKERRREEKRKQKQQKKKK